MPELPEVETTKRGVKPYLENQTFKSIKVRNKNLRIPFNTKLKNKILDSKIKQVSRRAKYIIIDFTNGFSVVIHLGMTGNLRVSKQSRFLKHDHIIFSLSSANNLIFNDVRRFGLVYIYRTKGGFYLLDNNGPDPFEQEATKTYLFNKISKSNASIKSILLNHTIISGIGNIYASEILFKTNISPFKEGKDVSEYECNEILKASRVILNKAIKAGGTTLNDYFNADAKPGYFKIQLNVYDRAGQPCKACNSELVRVVQSNRSTYFCKSCQKI